MPNNDNPLTHLPVAITLLLASTNKDFDRFLDTIIAVVTNAREAVRSIRQGVQTIQQVQVPKVQLPEIPQPPVPGKEAGNNTISLLVDTKEDD